VYGGEVCDMGYVGVRCDPGCSLVGFYVTPPNWLLEMPCANDAHDYAPAGASYVEYRYNFWYTAGEGTPTPDGTYHWRVVLRPPGGGGNVEASATFITRNTVVPTDNQLIFWDPAHTRTPGVDIKWAFTHKSITSTYPVDVDIYNVEGQCLRHLHAVPTPDHPTSGTVRWGGEMEVPPSGQLRYDSNGHFVLADPGVYAYQIRVAHGGGACHDSDKVTQFVTNVSYTQFEVDVPNSKVRGKISYHVGSDVGACFLKIYDPTLKPVYNVALDSTRGDHETEQFEFDFHPLTGIGNYTAVVFANQGPTAAAANRDMRAKWQVQPGAIHGFFPLAECWQASEEADFAASGVADALRSSYLGRHYEPVLHHAMPTRQQLLPRLQNSDDAIVLLNNHSDMLGGQIWIGATVGVASLYAVRPADSNAFVSGTDMLVSEGTWSKRRLVMFVTCNSAETRSDGGNLLHAVVDAGAEAAMGFVGTAAFSGCVGDWGRVFFDAACRRHLTLEEAAEEARKWVRRTYASQLPTQQSQPPDPDWGFGQYRFYPESAGHTSIVPARYGK